MTPNSRRTAWPKISPEVVRQNLTGHKILGLAVSALLYLVCLSGTVTVFALDLQHWETARLPDVASARPAAIAAAVQDARTRAAASGLASLGVFLPAPDNRRLDVVLGPEVRAYDAQGRYAGDGAHPITDGLAELHYYLHLPVAFGLVVVGASGVALLGLVLGGLLSHPRIFKDAFLWRLGSGARLNRTDLHNRIGVWGAPFHLMIAVTGAAVGLVNVMLLTAALSLHHGDAAKASAPLLGPAAIDEPDGRMTAAAIAGALETLARTHPEMTPRYMSVNSLGSDHESLSVTADVPARLVFGEQLEFDGTGRLRASHHLADGAAGKQIYASLYRLHFGNFGGRWVQWAYVLLGAGLCLICTTGMDIWLLKSAQRGRPARRLHQLWTGFVWAGPLAMAAAAALGLAAGIPFRPVFWGLTLGAPVAAMLATSQDQVSRAGRLATAAALIALAAIHVLKFGLSRVLATGPWPDLTLLLLGAGLAASAVPVRRAAMSSRRAAAQAAP
jgi:uncharacterized iron-regulated membrane protein